MRLLPLLFLFGMFSQGLTAQEGSMYRSDTLNVSIQLRYLFVTFGAGAEFPFRQHSFGLQAGYNVVPVVRHISREYNFLNKLGALDFNKDIIGALEYKRYIRKKSGSGKQFYYGSYLLFKNTEYASGHSHDWEGEWYKSNSVSIGPLLGYKFYEDQGTYLELFLGGHAGGQWGKLRHDNRDLYTQKRNHRYEPAKKMAYGIRFGLSLGFHPVRKKESSKE